MNHKTDGASIKTGATHPKVRGSGATAVEGRPIEDQKQQQQPAESTNAGEQDFPNLGEMTPTTRNDNDANHNSEAAKYAKRVIESNWSKYEMPPSDEEEEVAEGGMTGADYNYVLGSAQGAESHFRLKAEKEWEKAAESLGELSQEFFCLDLDSLERSLATIPLHTQIGLAEEELEAETLARFLRISDAAQKDLEQGVNVPENQRLAKQEVNQRLMAALRLDDSPKGDPLLPSNPATAHNVSLKGKPSASAPSQEPQTIKATDVSVESILENPSLRMKQPDVEQSTTNEDKEDLEFLDNLLDAESTSTKPATNVEHSEKRDLDDEEWLDEFLGD